MSYKRISFEGMGNLGVGMGKFKIPASILKPLATAVSFIPGVGPSASAAVTSYAASITARPTAAAPIVQTPNRPIDNTVTAPGWGAKEWIITGTGLVVLSGLIYIAVKRLKKRK